MTNTTTQQRITLQAHRASPGQILHTYTGEYAITEVWTDCNGTTIILDNGIARTCHPEEYVTVTVTLEYRFTY